VILTFRNTNHVSFFANAVQKAGEKVMGWNFDAVNFDVLAEFSIGQEVTEEQVLNLLQAATRTIHNYSPAHLKGVIEHAKTIPDRPEWTRLQWPSCDVTEYCFNLRQSDITAVMNTPIPRAAAPEVRKAIEWGCRRIIHPSFRLPNWWAYNNVESVFTPLSAMASQAWRRCGKVVPLTRIQQVVAAAYNIRMLSIVSCKCLHCEATYWPKAYKLVRDHANSQVSEIHDWVDTAVYAIIQKGREKYGPDFEAPNFVAAWSSRLHNHPDRIADVRKSMKGDFSWELTRVAAAALHGVVQVFGEGEAIQLVKDTFETFEYKSAEPELIKREAIAATETGGGEIKPIVIRTRYGHDFILNDTPPPPAFQMMRPSEEEKYNDPFQTLWNQPVPTGDIFGRDQCFRFFNDSSVTVEDIVTCLRRFCDSMKAEIRWDLYELAVLRNIIQSAYRSVHGDHFSSGPFLLGTSVKHHIWQKFYEAAKDQNSSLHRIGNVIRCGMRHQVPGHRGLTQEVETALQRPFPIDPVDAVAVAEIRQRLWEVCPSPKSANKLQDFLDSTARQSSWSAFAGHYLSYYGFRNEDYLRVYRAVASVVAAAPPFRGEVLITTPLEKKVQPRGKKYESLCFPIDGPTAIRKKFLEKFAEATTRHKSLDERFVTAAMLKNKATGREIAELRQNIYSDYFRFTEGECLPTLEWHLAEIIAEFGTELVSRLPVDPTPPPVPAPVVAAVVKNDEPKPLPPYETNDSVLDLISSCKMTNRWRAAETARQHKALFNEEMAPKSIKKLKKELSVKGRTARQAAMSAGLSIYETMSLRTVCANGYDLYTKQRGRTSLKGFVPFWRAVFIPNDNYSQKFYRRLRFFYVTANGLCEWGTALLPADSTDRPNIRPALQAEMDKQMGPRFATIREVVFMDYIPKKNWETYLRPFSKERHDFDGKEYCRSGFEWILKDRA
jgi:hypothetical protein